MDFIRNGFSGGGDVIQSLYEFYICFVDCICGVRAIFGFMQTNVTRTLKQTKPTEDNRKEK